MEVLSCQVENYAHYSYLATCYTFNIISTHWPKKNDDPARIPEELCYTSCMNCKGVQVDSLYLFVAALSRVCQQHPHQLTSELARRRTPTENQQGIAWALLQDTPKA